MEDNIAAFYLKGLTTRQLTEVFQALIKSYMLEPIRSGYLE